MATIAKTPKAVNYTAEQTTNVVTSYLAGVSVEKIALAVGHTTRSVIAKLARELKGTATPYVAKVRTTKSGDPVVKKNDVADKIGALLELAENDVDSLTKCTKVALNAILAKLSDTAESV